MNKKVLATILGCFTMAMLSIGIYYLSNGVNNIVDLENVSKETVENEETTENVQLANDRVADDGDVEEREAGSEETVSESSVNAQAMTFNEKSKLNWPVDGEVILEYSMDSTIYFPTLDEYKVNPALIIRGEQEAPVVAAADGIITEIGEDEQIGKYIKMALGNDYELTYGQLTNEAVNIGDTVCAGDVLAYVGEPTGYYAKEGSNVYFMLEKSGQSVDPLDYLAYE